MIALDVIQEMFAVLIALFLWRFAQSKISSESTTGKALAFILH